MITRNLSPKVGYLSLILGIIATIFANQAFSQVTVSPSNERHYAKYTINMDVSGSSGIEPGDTLFITFPSEVSLPASIDPSNVNVIMQDFPFFGGGNAGSAQAQAVVIDGQTVKVVSPLTVDSSDPWFITDAYAIVEFASAAQIINPETAATYTINYQHPGNSGNFNFDITTSSSTLSSPSVTPINTLENQQTKYIISFNVGSGGYLNDGEGSFTVNFPTGTDIPVGFIEGAYIKTGVTPVLASASGVESGGDTLVTIENPTGVSIDNNESVSIIFSKGSGISNPNLPDNPTPAQQSKTLTVYSSVENTPVTSDAYTITPASDVSTPSVSTTTSFANANTEYSIEFTMGNTTTDTLNALEDSIRVSFPALSDFPTSVSSSNIIIEAGGFTDVPNGVYVNGNNLTFDMPFTINPADQVILTLQQGAGITNPATPNNYTVDVTLIGDSDRTYTSSPFSVTPPPSSITNADVNVADNSASSVWTGDVTTTYTISFNTGSYGRLVGGSSTITMDFLNPYDSWSGVTAYVNGDLTNLTVTDAGERIIQLDVPATVSVGNNEQVTVELQNLTNPTLAANYNINIQTSSEPEYITSNDFNIGGSSVETTVAPVVTDNYVNTTAQYQVDFHTQTRLQTGDNDYISFTFPEGTVLPSTIDPADVTLSRVSDGATANISSINVSPSSRVIDLYPASNIPASNNGDNYRVVFSSSAGIQNPTIALDSYAITVSTTKDEAPSNTPTYSIIANPTAVSSLGMNVVPNVVTQTDAAYQFSFTTGSNGKLLGGTDPNASYIDISMGNETVVPGSINSGDVTVNSTSVTNAEVTTSGAGGDVRIWIPSGLTIGNNEGVTVSFSSGAGLDNGSNTSSETFTVTTSSQNTAATTTNALQNSSSLSAQNVTLSSDKANATSGYTIKFSLGTAQSLAPGDSIRLTFPTETGLPAFIGKNNVTIDNTNPSVNGRVDQTNNYITFTLASALASDEVLTLRISSSAGIVNPVTASPLYNISFTTFENEGGGSVTSTTDQTSNYAITTSNSSISQPTVSLDEYVQNNLNTNYEINFETGQYGRLIGGSSTIQLTFDAAYDFGTTPPSSVSLNSTNASFSVDNARQITVDVPAGVDIGNYDLVELSIDGITNPTSGSYSIDVQTSEEPTDVQSQSYTISVNSGKINFTSVTFTNGADTVNQNFAMQVQFTVPSAANTVSLRFPETTVIPTNILTSYIQIGDGTNMYDVSNISVNSGQYEITLTPDGGYSLSSGTTHFIEISASAGMVQPRFPDSYYLKGYTDTQPALVESDPEAGYTIYKAQGSKLIINSITFGNTILGLATSNTWDMTTGDNGAVKSVDGFIRLIFPQNFFSLPSVINKSTITINGENPRSVNVSFNNIDVDGDLTTYLTLYIPNTVTIGNNTDVMVEIDAGAGISILDLGVFGKKKGGSSTQGNGGGSIPQILSDELRAETSSEGGTGGSNPLPVELTDFDVKKPSTNQPAAPTLEWSTATEKENYGFHIERSFISRKLAKQKSEIDTTWKRVAFVDGQGTTTRENSYSWTDNNISEAGYYNYRLIQEDYNGKSTVYGPVEYNYTGPEVFELGQNYPNPFNPTTRMNYKIAEQTDVSIRVYNILGRKVQTLINENLQPGTYTVRFDGASLASGTYFVRMTANGQVFTNKMMLIK